MRNVTKFVGAALTAGSLMASQPAAAQYYWAPPAYYWAPPVYYAAPVYDPSGAIVAGMALGIIGAAAAASQYAYPYPYTYARPWIGCVAPWRCW